MVGVPGRSKGCNTCRKRRIACSLETPQCSQCIKSKRDCGGYQRERIWVPNNQVKFEAVISVSDSSSDEPSLTPTTDATVTHRNKATRKSVKAVALAPNRESGRSQSLFRPACPQLPKIVSPYTLLRQQLLSSFLEDYIPEKQKTSIRPPQKTEQSWLMLISDLPSLTPALSTSLLALSTAALGRLHGDDVLIFESRRLYCRALVELQRALWDPNLMYEDDTLAACLSLGLYEVMECPAENAKGWLMHSGGCLRLVELRGPEAHKEGLGHQLFLACRFSSIIQGLGEKRTNFLSSPRWLSIPWSTTPKTITDRLEDIFLSGTKILEAAEYLGSLDVAASLIPALKVVEACWALDAEVQKIYDELQEAMAPSPLFWPVFSKLANLADDPPVNEADDVEGEEGKSGNSAGRGKIFPVAYQFPSLGVAHQCCLYWSICIVLWGGMGYMYGALAQIKHNASVPIDSPSTLSESSSLSSSTAKSPSPETCDCTSPVHTCPQQLANFSFASLPPLEHRVPIGVLSSIQNICQSFEYSFEPQFRGIGAASMAFPLQIAIGTMKDIPGMERQISWARAAVGMINGKGFRILKYEAA